MIIDTITDLQSRGFTSDFSLFGNHLFCAQLKCFIETDQFDIVEVHCFDDELPNKEETVLYAIEWFTNSVKGILLENRYDYSGILTNKIKKFWK